MAFGLDFFTVAPGLRLAGDSVAFAYKFTGKGGQLKGLQGLEIGLVDDPTVKLLEGSVTGYEQVADRDVAYNLLLAGGLTEIVPGLALGIDSLSSIETGGGSVRLAVAGQQPTLVFRNANVAEVTKVGDGGYTWDVPAAAFAALKTAAESYESDLATKVDQMIADRISADGVLQTALDAQAVSDATARGVIQADVDQNEADSDAADAALSGRLDVLEADPTTATAVAAVQSDVDANQSASESADAALSGRLDVLEADPTTATAVAAVQSDVDANEADSDAADAALSGRLDTLEADPVTKAYVDGADTTLQNNIDSEAGARASADSALDGRLDVLEADPTTATAVAAVQSDVDANQTASESADAALSGRLDVLEADPTTATALTDGLALKAPLADPDFTGQLEVDVNLRLEYDSNLTKIHNILRGTSIEIGNNIQMRPAAAGGRVEIAGGLQIDITEVPEYSNDTQAAAGGIIVGGLYRSGSVLHIRVS